MAAANKDNLQEKSFKKKLQELGLSARDLKKIGAHGRPYPLISTRTKYREESKVNYGVLQRRFWITIFKGNRELEKTSSGFCAKMDNFQELGYEQGNRRLHKIEMYGLHKQEPKPVENQASYPEENEYDHRGYF